MQNLEEQKELNILISTDTKIVSINSLYSVKIAYVAGHPRPQMYKSANAQKFASEVTDQLHALKLGDDWKEWFRNTKSFSMTVNFILKTGIGKRDVSNMDKLLIDTITRYVHDDLGVETFDDSLFSSVQFFKSELPKSKKEYCIVQIRESSDNLRFDVVPIPETIWCWDKNNKLDILPLPKRKKKGVRYFESRETRNDANTFVYILSPETFSPDIYSDILQDLDQLILGSTGFLCLGILGMEKDWGNNWAWIQTLKNRFLGSGCRRVKAGEINDKNEILDWLRVW
jgi:hypothetical protein